MEQNNIVKIIRDYNLFGTVPDTDVLISALREADDAYFNDAPIVSDAQYDAVKQIAHTLFPTHAYFQQVGSAVRGGKIKLPYTMGSLTQVYEGDVGKWVANYNLEREMVIVSDKLDGVSILMVYDSNGALQIAYSRGDGTMGADVTRHARKINNLPKKGIPDAVIRAEVIFSETNFKKLGAAGVKSRSGDEYKNARNAAAGIMNAETNPAAVYDLIDVVCYEIVNAKETANKQEQLDRLTEAGFNVVRYFRATGYFLTFDNLKQAVIERKSKSDYALDGVVIDVDDAEKRMSINPSKNTLNPEYARKFKVADEDNYAVATVVDVEWNVSKDGYLKPTVIIEPVELVGVTVRRCTGFNAKFIVDNGIGKGAHIAVVRSGDVIPYICSVMRPAKLTSMPEHACHWNATSVDLVVDNAAELSEVRVEQLIYFFDSIDVPNLGEAAIREMFNCGFETPESIINVDQIDLNCMLGSETVGKKIMSNMKAKFTSIPEHVVMGAHPAFGRGVGSRKMKKLYEACAGDLSQLTHDFIVSVEGFDDKTATKVVAGLPQYLTFKAAVAGRVTFAEYIPPATGDLSGKSFVFTGFRSPETERMIEDRGGKISTSVSSKTSYVVADSVNSSSGKVTKARSCGVPVIEFDELKTMLGV